jgi:hypothetical protein
MRDDHVPGVDPELWRIDAPLRCVGCGAHVPAGGAVARRGERAFCLRCARLDHLAFVPDDALAIARGAFARSRARAVVLARASPTLIGRDGVFVEQRALWAAIDDAGEHAPPPGALHVAPRPALHDE